MIGTERSPCWDGKTHMAWRYHDGGRAEAGFKGSTRDCVTRSIAIATGRPYREVYDALNALATRERPRAGSKRSSARTGVAKPTIRRYLATLGWSWHPTMAIGSGATVHLCEEELPMGRLIVSVSRHLTCVIDRVVFDTFDCQRDTIMPGPDGSSRSGRIARRCVYGYFQEPGT